MQGATRTARAPARSAAALPGGCPGSPLRRRLRLLFGLGVLGACALGCGSPERPTRIVLITFDTLRWDRFDGGEACMPEVAAAAERGLVFEDCYASTSSTQPTHASLFTGLHPWQHGVPRNGAVLPPEARTLAERLRQAGYYTAAAVGSFPLHAKFGFDQGFDAYLDDFEEREGQDEWNDVELESGFYNLADRVAEGALQLVDGAPETDQFLWFHFYDPHSPYGDSPEGGPPMPLNHVRLGVLKTPAEAPALIERARRLYDQDVEYMDRAAARILRRLDEDAARFETHVLLTADHGESFGEEGSLGHGKRVIRSQVHVPLVLLSPRVRPGRVRAAAGSVDVPPTILRLAGLPLPEDMTGRDLASPLPADGTVFGMRRTFVEPFRDVRTDGSVVEVKGPRFFAARKGRLHIGDADGVLVEGRGEGAPATGDPPDGPAESDLRALFGAFEAELEGQAVTELLDDETQRALEALGYAR